MGLFWVFLWVLPSVLVGVWIGHSLGKQSRAAKSEEDDSISRETVLKALTKMLESTERLTTDVGTHNNELAEVGRDIGELNFGDHFGDVQHTLVRKIAAVIESNQRLEDDLVCTRYQMENQAQELDRSRVEARTDALSGVANRKAFDETLAYLLSTFHRSSDVFALAMLDIDYFKRINDTHGHQAGDHVVQDIAAHLRSLVRGTDYVARFGGDEFAILFTKIDPTMAVTVADRIRGAVERRNFDVSDDGERIAVTCSMGLAVVRQGDTGETLLARADEALYKAKRGGRNQLQCQLEEPVAV